MKFIKEKLHEEIQEELTSLKSLPVGSDEYKAVVDGLTKLVDRTIEIQKIENDGKDKSEESKLKLEQFMDEKKDRWIKNGLTAAGIIIPVFVTVWGTVKTFKFEETGSITTPLGRGFVNKLIPKK